MKRVPPHADSYYSATANDAKEYPQLTEDISADICVIGGGFSGVAAALSLTERGHSVALLESNRIGWGASGRNGGQLLAGWSGESALVKQAGQTASDFLWQTRYRGNDIVEARIKKYNIACDFVRGTITTALKPAQMIMLNDEYEECRQRGHADSLEMVAAESIRKYVGTDTYIGGLADKRSAHLHPLNLCAGEARAADGLGAKIYENSSVVEIVHGQKPLIKTGQGSMSADFVVLAGNAYHRLERNKLHGYMLPTETYVVATEILPDEIADEILPQNSGVCDANIVLDYFRLSADKRLIFGGGCNYLNTRNIDAKAELLPRIQALFPQLSHVGIDYSWSGVMGIPLNRIPMVGRVSDNIFYAQGYSGHGVNCSHITAEIICDAIENNSETLDIFDNVSHFRIPAADYIGNPMLALGMLYYRMKDRLGINPEPL